MNEIDEDLWLDSDVSINAVFIICFIIPSTSLLFLKGLSKRLLIRRPITEIFSLPIMF